MKTLLTIATLALVASGAMSAVAASSEDAMMAEMEKCAVCKNLAANPELLENMTWETHKLDNGMMCVTTVSEEFKADFDSLNAKVKTSVEKVKADQQQGKAVPLCDLCADMGQITEAGAKEKEIKIPNGSIHMMTSDDPAVVEKIHANADKAIAMQKQMASK
jgi:hypothetical protein